MTTPWRIPGVPVCLILLGAIMYGQTPPGTLQTTSGASYGPIVSPDSIAAIWGTNLASMTASAPALPLPFSLGNVQVTITDSAGAKINAPLFLVSPGQINFQIPANVALGRAMVNITSSTSATGALGTLLVSNIAPSIFTANADGKGVPAAQIQRVTSAGVSSFEMPFTSTAPYSPTPLTISNPGDRVYLILYGTGIRRHSANPVSATIGGISVPVLYAGPQNQFLGLDQINIGPIPVSLVNRGLVAVMVTVDGVPANSVQIAIQ